MLTLPGTKIACRTVYLKTGRDRKYKIENEEICKLVQSNHGHVEHDGLWGAVVWAQKKKK